MTMRTPGRSGFGRGRSASREVWLTDGDPYVRDLVSGGHVEAMSHQQQRRVMLFAVVTRDAIGRDDDVEIVEHRVACRRLDAASVVQPPITTVLIPLLRSSNSRSVPQKALERCLPTTNSSAEGASSSTKSYPGVPGMV